MGMEIGLDIGENWKSFCNRRRSLHQYTSQCILFVILILLAVGFGYAWTTSDTDGRNRIIYVFVFLLAALLVSIAVLIYIYFCCNEVKNIREYERSQELKYAQEAAELGVCNPGNPKAGGTREPACRWHSQAEIVVIEPKNGDEVMTTTIWTEMERLPPPPPYEDIDKNKNSQNTVFQPPGSS